MVVEQKENDVGYIFYVNKKTGERQNDNPKLLEIMQVIHDQHKYIKYVTYRCATKIWLLKQSFYSKYSRIDCVWSPHFGPNKLNIISASYCSREHSLQLCDGRAEPFRTESM